MVFALFACTIALQQGGPTTPLGPPKPVAVPKKKHGRTVVHKQVSKPPAPPPYIDNPAGSGLPVKLDDLVTIQFLVKRQSGESIADSKKRGLPYSFKIGAPGNDPLLDMVVKGMKVGAVRTQTVAAKDAYGLGGAPPAISPKDVLIVQVTLLHRGPK